MTATMERPIAPAPAPQPVHGWLPGAVLWRCRGCRKKVLGWVAPAVGVAGVWVLLVRISGRPGLRLIEAKGTEFRQQCDECACINHWPGDV